MEKWKDIKGYEGIYQVSNLGRVKSLSRILSVNSTNTKYISNEKILKQRIDAYGYYRCSLYKNKIKKDYLTHRLISIAFIYNLNKKPFVNHINGIKSDNRIDNLEWCTHKENIQHAINLGLMIPNSFGMKSRASKILLNQDTGVFYNLKEAANSLGIHSATLIDRLKGKSKIKTSFIYT